MPDKFEVVALGVVVGAHGVKGELRVKPYNPDSPHLGRTGPRFLRKQVGQAPQAVDVAAARRHGGLFLLTIDGCRDRDTAAALRGAEILVLRSALAATTEGEYYHSDLVGLTVRRHDDAHPEAVGRVTSVTRVGGADLLVIHDNENKELLVPFVDAFILRVDLAVHEVWFRLPDEEAS
jgi:16S rRNA processing protein RimM